MRRFAAVMACLLMGLFWAAPAQAQAQGCYPPPCGAPNSAQILTVNGLGSPRGPAWEPSPTGRTVVPFVALGLLMVGATFSTIAVRRRLAVVRSSRPILAWEPGDRPSRAGTRRPAGLVDR